jgi:hypothetical protein
MSCNCDYSVLKGTPCVSCLNRENVASKATITQKRIWKQVRAASSSYAMNLSALTSGAAILASGSNTNWNQMSDRVSASKQPVISPTHGNSLRSTLTSGRPGASTPGGKGVDVKHDSYARYLNRKKAGVVKTQTKNSSPVALYGNKTHSVGLLSNSIHCCT